MPDDVYALDVGSGLCIYRCQWVGTHFRMFGDRPGYVPQAIERDRLNAMIRGRVVGEIRVKDRNAVFDAMQALSARLDQMGRASA